MPYTVAVQTEDEYKDLFLIGVFSTKEEAERYISDKASPLFDCAHTFKVQYINPVE